MGNKSGTNKSKNEETFTEFLHEIRTLKDWNELCARPKEPCFAHTQVVKIVINVRDRLRIYFLNSEAFVFHNRFVYYHLAKYCNDKVPFNTRQYETEERDFILGSLTFYEDQNVWTFELWAGDNLRGTRLSESFRNIQSKVFFGDQLRYRPASQLHLDMISSVPRSYGPVVRSSEFVLPLISSDQIFGDIKFQPLTVGQTYGYLRIFREGQQYDKKDSLENILPNTIVITDYIPNELPVCAGLVTSVLQTPLCHVAILCGNRGTPNMALTTVFDDDDKILALDRQIVKLWIKLQDFVLEPSTTEEFQRFLAWKNERKKVPPLPVVSLDNVGLLNFKEMNGVQAPCCGSKATHLAAISKLTFDPKVIIAEGFVIPFYYYDDHIERAQTKPIIAELLTAAAEITEVSPLDQQEQFVQFAAEKVAAIEKSITESKDLPAELMENITLRIQDWERKGLCNDGVIFRSSTNVEDLAGFNGAGLYLSEVVKRDKMHPENFQEAVLKVWSSVWNLKGFKERHFYGIDQSRISMAILVQPWMSSNVAGNGVAVTANPFRSDLNAYFVNTQTGGKSVTDGTGTPEQILIYDIDQKPVAEVIASSSESIGKPIIQKDNLELLYLTLSTVHDKYMEASSAVRKEGSEFSSLLESLSSFQDKAIMSSFNCVDVEFLLLKDGRLVLLQCRPFKVARFW